MKPSLLSITAIIKKDLVSLLPLVILAAVVFVMEPIFASLVITENEEIWSMLVKNFYWISYGIATLLMISVLQQDPAASLTHDWLSRPISKREWLLAKCLFLILTIGFPIVLARFFIYLSIDYGLIFSIGYALAIDKPAVLLITPFLFAAALLAPTLKRVIFLILTVFIVFFSPAWNGAQPLFALLGVDLGTSYKGMMWLQALPMALVGVATLLGVYWLSYCLRRQHRAYITFIVGLVFFFLSMFPPTAVYNWDTAIAVHKSLINTGDEAALEDSLVLDHARACFPAATFSEGAKTEFEQSLIQQADWMALPSSTVTPGSLTFATTIKGQDTLVEWLSPSNTSRHISVDWLIDKIRVQAQLVSKRSPAGIPLRRSTTALNRYAPMSSTSTDYWLVPDDYVNRFANDPSTRLILDFDLALLSPTAYELKTDGQRRTFPELGSCRAVLEQDSNSIEIDCIKRGKQPSIVSAQLVGVGSSRVDSDFRTTSFKAGWLASLGRGQYELSLKSPNLVDSSVIIVSAYTVKRVLNKRVVSAGLLGNASDICPLPNGEQLNAIEKSNWTDKSTHEISSVAVERGVRVEVLDWRVQDELDKPNLVLLHGGGATAHTYDEIAPKLAKKYNVIGITRRGIGGSSKPDHGYDIARLSQDVLQVLDTLEIDSPTLVGHSLAGEELSYLGANFPERFSGLIYLDAAYDRSRTRKTVATLLPTRPPPRPSESISYDS